MTDEPQSSGARAQQLRETVAQMRDRMFQCLKVEELERVEAEAFESDRSMFGGYRDSELLELGTHLSEEHDQAIYDHAQATTAREYGRLLAHFDKHSKAFVSTQGSIAEDLHDVGTQLDELNPDWLDEVQTPIDDWNSDAAILFRDSFSGPLDTAMTNHRNEAWALSGAAAMNQQILLKLRENLQDIADAGVAALDPLSENGQDTGLMLKVLDVANFLTGMAKDTGALPPIAGSLITVGINTVKGNVVTDVPTEARSPQWPVTTWQLGMPVMEVVESIHAAIDEAEEIAHEEEEHIAIGLRQLLQAHEDLLDNPNDETRGTIEPGPPS